MLSERDRATLEVEAKWWRYAGAKEAHVREVFGESMTRYYQRVNALLDDPDALAADPVNVKRLRRLRAAGQRDRPGRT